MAQVTTINYDGTTKNSPVMPYKAAKFLYKQLRRNKPNNIHALHYV